MAAGGLWFLSTRSPTDDLSEFGGGLVPDRPREATSPTLEPAERPEAAALVAPLAAPQTPGDLGASALEGQVQDRFGQPVVGERVWLLTGNQSHPPGGADLSAYITGLTNRQGSFSLSADGPGPWALAVGPAGHPSIAPSEARSLSVGGRVEVVLPGRTLLNVTFPDIEAGADQLSLLVEYLGEGGPAQGVRTGRGRIETGLSPDRAPRTRRRGRDRSEREDRNGQLTPATSIPTPLLAAFPSGQQQDPTQTGRQRGRGRNRADAQGQANRRADRRGKKEARSGAQQKPTEVQSPPLPPTERWKTASRQTLPPPDEQGKRTVLIGGLTPGKIARLVLKVGMKRYEGTSRFSLVKDARTEIQVFPLPPGPGSQLNYSMRTMVLGAHERPAGVRWQN